VTSPEIPADPGQGRHVSPAGRPPCWDPSAVPFHQKDHGPADRDVRLWDHHRPSWRNLPRRARRCLLPTPWSTWNGSDVGGPSLPTRKRPMAYRVQNRTFFATAHHIWPAVRRTLLGCRGRSSTEGSSRRRDRLSCRRFVRTWGAEGGVAGYQTEAPEGQIGCCR